MNILIADDNEQDCHLLQVLLARKGNAVVTAANGAEALEKARLNPPDLIITDILMPVMDGFSLCREWKQDERLRDIPLIFYTGAYTGERDREFALGLGAARIIPKPEDLDNLLRTIQAVMTEQERGRLAVSPKTMQGDAVYLKEYNEVLIRKLEDKMSQLEQTSRELERDITERKRAEEALRRSETKFRTLYDSTSDAVMLLDLKGFFDCTQAALAIFGCATREEFCSKHPADLSPPMQPCGTDSLTLANRRIVTAMKQGSHHFEWMHKRADTGGTFPADVLLSAMELDGKRVLQAVVRDITERKRAEEALRESEEQYRRLFEDSMLAISQSSIEGRLIRVNIAYARMYGYASPEQMIAEVTDVGRLYANPEGREETLRILSEKGVMGPREMTVTRRDGIRFHVEVQAQEVRDVAGKLICYQASHVDVTERKRAEDALRASEGLYRQLFNALPDGIVVIDSDGLIKSANRAQSQLYHYDSPEEMVGISPVLLITPAMREYGRDIMRRRLGGEVVQNVEYRLLRKDGTEFWGNTSATLLRNTSGSITGYICVTHDTTVRKRAEEVLRESELRFRTVYERAAMGIVVVDVGGRIAQANAFFQCMLGRSSEDLVGRKFEEFTHPEEAEVERASFQKALEEGSADAQFQKRYVRNDGQTICANLSTTICHDAAGKPQFVIGLVENITERKRAEEALRSSQEQFRALAARIEHIREEERASLARELHDELGQRLTALQIDLAWLDSHLRTAGLADLPVLRDKIAAMVPRAERLIETTQAISSTMRPGVLDDLGLVAAIEWLAADFEKRTGLACMATLPATDIALDLGLAVVLFRIVQEALTNVIRHAKATRVEIRLSATEGELTLEVEDNGRGIVPQEIADPRSLGLFSMRERAAALGGTVDFRSGTGRGTTVSVKVPVA